LLRTNEQYFFQATPIATKTLPALPQSFFARPAEVGAPELIGCLLVKCQEGGELLWGVIVETEAYSQEEPAYLLWWSFCYYLLVKRKKVKSFCESYF